jgi:hypothetical protein
LIRKQFVKELKDVIKKNIKETENSGSNIMTYRDSINCQFWSYVVNSQLGKMAEKGITPKNNLYKYKELVKDVNKF